MFAPALPFQRTSDMRGLANGRKKQLASFRPGSRAARSATSHSRRACPKLAERGLSEDAVTAILDREAASWFDGKQIVVRSDAARCAGPEVLAEINQLRAPRGRDLKARTRGPKSAAWRAKYVRGSVQRRTRENDGWQCQGVLLSGVTIVAPRRGWRLCAPCHGV